MTKAAAKVRDRPNGEASCSSQGCPLGSQGRPLVGAWDAPPASAGAMPTLATTARPVTLNTAPGQGCELRLKGCGMSLSKDEL